MSEGHKLKKTSVETENSEADYIEQDRVKDGKKKGATLSW
jgi:hypothetical protein